MTTTATKPRINTAKAERRKLRFNSVPEAIAEAERIARLEVENTIKYTGKVAGDVITGKQGGGDRQRDWKAERVK